MILDYDNDKYFRLLKAHCRQYQNLLNGQRLRRDALAKKHQKQRTRLYDLGFTAKIMARLLKQQSNELMQIHMLEIEARMQLKALHSRQKHNFLNFMESV